MRPLVDANVIIDLMAEREPSTTASRRTRCSRYWKKSTAWSTTT